MPEPVIATDAPEGMLLAVIGPSGAGKDSLIGYARRRLPSTPLLLFVRRVVTRAATASAEDHDTLTVEEFAGAEAAGRFAVTWDAHGLRYGVPAAARRHVKEGGVAVLNGSRAALPHIRSAFGRVVSVHVTVRPEILAARLAGRGRETQDDVLRRLRRGAMVVPDAGETIEIDNSGPLAAAGESLAAVIRRCLSQEGCLP